MPGGDTTGTVTRSASPGARVTTLAVGEQARPLTKLAYLPHFMGKTVDAAVPLEPMADLDPARLHAELQRAFAQALEFSEDAWVQEQLDKRKKEEEKTGKKSADKRRTKKDFFGVDSLTKVPIALVDLTEDARRPKLAGFNLTASRHPASTSKLACLFAAHQLRFDLQRLAKTSKVKTQAELFALARQGWGLTQTPAKDAKREPLRRKGSPTIERQDRLVLFGGAAVTVPKPAKNGTTTAWSFLAPNLERIFDDPARAGGSLAEFRSTGESFPDLFQYEYPEQFPDHTGKLAWKDKAERAAKLEGLGFKERLALMVGQSHNPATGSCVHDVGYLYIASALMQAGFYDADVGGLWMGASYGGTTFKNDPVNNRNLSTSPLAHARLMTRFARLELVSEEACQAMRPLLRKRYHLAKDWVQVDVTRKVKGRSVVIKEWVRTNAAAHLTDDPGTGTRSPFEPGVERSAKSAAVYSKLGLLGGAFGVSDVAWILRQPRPLETDDGRKLDHKRSSFVLVGLNSNDEALTVIAEAAAAAVQELNAPTP